MPRVVVRPGGAANVDICVAEEEDGVDVGRDEGVSVEELFEIGRDEVVEGVDVLLDETFGFEEGGEELPFFLQGGWDARQQGGGRGEWPA